VRKTKVAYVCVHNSCRSQIAEALTMLFHFDFFEAYSGGIETKPEINQDAVRIVKQLYAYDMNIKQSSKLIDELPDDIDILITMGCNVECPTLPCKFREDWGLDDPSGEEDQMFIKTSRLIQEKIEKLRKRIEDKSIVL